MNKELTIEKIYNTLMEKGKVSTRADVMGIDPMEDKVYVKRLSINKNLGEGANAIELVYVTIKSDDESFNDTSASDMRLNTRNVQDKWCNIFINEATEDMLELVEATIA